jgi:hypothetical protein
MSVFQDLCPETIANQKYHMNMGLILNGHEDMGLEIIYYIHLFGKRLYISV